MKEQIVTKGIVLHRTNFQEADRIVNVLTPTHGKLHIMAKGVRRPKSKLAGGIELFTESELTVLPSRGEVQTLVSARMDTHYAHIVKDIQRTMLGYDLLKQINRVTEEASGEEYYDVLKGVLVGLDDLALPIGMVEFWFGMHLLDASGHAPNLLTDASGEKLQASVRYMFDYEAMAFQPHPEGMYDANYIRLWRLMRSAVVPNQLTKVGGVGAYLPQSQQMVRRILQVTLHI